MDEGCLEHRIMPLSVLSRVLESAMSTQQQRLFGQGSKSCALGRQRVFEPRPVHEARPAAQLDSFVYGDCDSDDSLDAADHLLQVATAA